MSDYGIEQEIGAAVVKSEFCCVREVWRLTVKAAGFVSGPRFVCPYTGDDAVPPSDVCRACWHEWAKDVLRGEE